MNEQNNTTPIETHPYKVLFTPQGILAFVHCILPEGGVLRFDKTGTSACACFDNLIDYNKFKYKLAEVRPL